MSNDVNKMELKQLRNEVQMLRDELAIMKRKYEDIIYNLDTDNFSSRFVKEQGDMRTAIEITAEGIKTKVSNEEFESAMSQTSEKIETEVYALDDKLSTRISQTANEIYAEVSALDSDISTISVKANGISTRVGKLENGEYADFTLFEQTIDGFQFTGDVKIVGVDNNLSLGDLTSNWDKKTIRFNKQATIGTYNYMGLGQDGLIISANGFGIDCRPDYIYLTAPDGSSFLNDRITLEEYVTTYGNGSGSGTAIAVFG